MEVDIPEQFKCPITSEVMEFPFTTAAGNSYEYSAIVQWLKTKRTDPLTNTQLEDQSIFPNHALRSAIQAWFENNPDAAGLRNASAPRPPADAYTINSSRPKSTEDCALDRILRVNKAFEVDRGSKGQRLLPEDRLEEVVAYGHRYSTRWDHDLRAYCIRCNNGPWLEASEPDFFVTSLGVMFYDRLDMNEARILPGTDMTEACMFGSGCTKEDCVFAHPFVCSYGLGCRKLRNNTCKFLHPDRSSLKPLGANFPDNVDCKHSVTCSAKSCNFAHTRGRMTITRCKARLFITHSLTLQALPCPIEVFMPLPESSTVYRVQGEFIFGFEPYAGTWAKDHYKTVTALRFDPSVRSYRVIGEYSLDRHYCNSVAASGRYMILSFWPYEEEAMRTVWECMRFQRMMEKSLKQKDGEIEVLQRKLREKEAELSSVLAEKAALECEVASLRSALYQARQHHLAQSKAVINHKDRELSIISYHQIYHRVSQVKGKDNA